MSKRSREEEQEIEEIEEERKMLRTAKKRRLDFAKDIEKLVINRYRAYPGSPQVTGREEEIAFMLVTLPGNITPAKALAICKKYDQTKDHHSLFEDICMDAPNWFMDLTSFRAAVCFRPDIFRCAKEFGPCIAYLLRPVDVLKGYLKEQGLKSSGKREVLQDRVFTDLKTRLQKLKTTPPIVSDDIVTLSLYTKGRVVVAEASARSTFSSVFEEILHKGFNFDTGHLYNVHVPKGKIISALDATDSFDDYGVFPEEKELRGNIVTLANTGCRVGEKITITFDYGDDWKFVMTFISTKKEEVSGVASEKEKEKKKEKEKEKEDEKEMTKEQKAMEKFMKQMKTPPPISFKIVSITGNKVRQYFGVSSSESECDSEEEGGEYSF